MLRLCFRCEHTHPPTLCSSVHIGELLIEVMGLLLLHSIPMSFSYKGLHVCRRPSLHTGTLLKGAANMCPAAQDFGRTLLGFAGVQEAF